MSVIHGVEESGTANSTSGSRLPAHKLLAIYLNNHLSGATAGADLARRVASHHQNTGVEGPLLRIGLEVAEDRDSLLNLMRRLEVPVRRSLVYAGWAAEKMGRLKFNGALIRRSPLSPVVELEGLHMGVQGKASLWRSLRGLADHDDRLDVGELDQLIERAQAQGAMLERLRVEETVKALTAR